MEEKQAIQEAFTEMSFRYEEVVDEELNLFWGWSYDGFINQLLHNTEFYPNHKILDIATGTAVIPRKIGKNNIPGIQITGLDITESMLKKALSAITGSGISTHISLTCGDGMSLPFVAQSFDLVLSGLASHHMNIPVMLSEMKRVLKDGGTLSIIDVGTSPLWEIPILRGFGKVFAFIYFFFKNNIERAWAEFHSVTNLRTPEGWMEELHSAGFNSIEIRELPSKYRWFAEPLTIKAKRQSEDS
jgi:ubiquinone/menaquinone biosynthesis C-methylase UbiE